MLRTQSVSAVSWKKPSNFRFSAVRTFSWWFLISRSKNLSNLDHQWSSTLRSWTLWPSETLPSTSSTRSITMATTPGSSSTRMVRVTPTQATRRKRWKSPRKSWIRWPTTKPRRNSSNISSPRTRKSSGERSLKSERWSSRPEKLHQLDQRALQTSPMKVTWTSRVKKFLTWRVQPFQISFRPK